MSSYTLACECGQTHVVSAAQAGGQLVCYCGKRLDVPPLRLLRHLPPAAEQRPETSAAWNVRKGTIAVCVILAGLLAALGLWSRLTEPRLPVFDPAVQSEFVDKGLDQLTPLEAWRAWIAIYRPLAEQGLSVLESPHAPAIRTMIARKRFAQTIMLSLAGALTAAAIAIALWPAAEKGRQGDKEVRKG